MAPTLVERERFRDEYYLRRDPIAYDRLSWRAQTFRHLVHILPGETILELGCGKGFFTRHLSSVTRGENPITSVTMDSELGKPEELAPHVEFVNLANDVNALQGRQFDYVVAVDMLDESNCGSFLQEIERYLKPGGQMVLYESNPWNLMVVIRGRILRLFGRRDPRRLVNRTKLCEMISEIGFIRVFTLFNDFMYAPLTRGMIWLLRNLSMILENMPFVQTLAASILIFAQKPPRKVERRLSSLAEHESLKKSVSVVVPCHNEEMNIRPLVSQLIELYGDYIFEIIPVEDNSRDKTADVLRELAAQDCRIKPVFRTPPNGVGRALQDGFRAAQGEYVLSMDCDFQHLLPEMRDLFDAAAQGYDVVFGSRFSRHSVLLNYPIQKIIANRGFHALARILLWKDIRDVTNNLKLIRRNALQQLDLTQPGFSINAETGLQPVLMGYTFKEVPISWINRTPDMGVSSFRLAKVGGGYTGVLFRLWRDLVFRRRFKSKPNKTTASLME